MRKIVFGIIIVSFGFLVLVGCSDKSPPPASSDVSADGTPNIVHEDKSVKIIRSMMELNYASMTVAEFNETIQTLCADADTTVFEVISNAYDHYSVYDDSGEFMYYLFSDHSLETFMQTTLSYSAQEIFGEPVHLGNIMYMTMPNMTAMEVSQKREQMQPDEWERYFEEHIADISVFPVLSYAIEANIQDPGAIMVSERDSKINDIHSAIKEFLLGLDAEAVMAETLEDDILAEFERLSTMYSDDKMMVECRIQSIERDI